ncbi:MAG: uridine phosphorylase, partial [Caldiserica bacterium]
MDKDKQYHIGLKKGDVGRYVLLPGDPKRTELIAKFFDNAKEVAFNREFRTFVGWIDKIKVMTTSTGIGCPSCAICIEELSKLGAEIFIRVGTTGALQDNIKLSD